MLDRRIRQAGVSLIEAALAKVAAEIITAPSLAVLKAMKTRELNGPTTASAAIPKVVSAPLP